jgi:ABC-type uncharacterized transport system permease subunit
MPEYLPANDPPEAERPALAERLSGREARWAAWGALKAAFLLAGIFSAVMALVVAALRAMWGV